MRSVLLLILTLLSFSAFSQKVSYFSRNFQYREHKKTPQKRLYFTDDTSVRVEDYENEHLFRKSNIEGTRSLDEIDAYMLYVQASHVEANRKPYFAKLKGSFIYLSHAGKPTQELHVKGYSLKYGQIWNQEQVAMLTNGTGQSIFWSPSKDQETHTHYQDSILVESYTIRSLQKDTIYHKFDEIAHPKEGFQTFNQYLSQAIKYSGLSQSLGNDGVIYMEFIVDKKGQLTELKSLKKDFLFDQAAIERVAAYPAWEPATFKGKPVKTRFVLPLRFNRK